MSVKRYSVGVDGVDQNGNLVKYSDYQALLDELEAKEEQRANWFQMAEKLGAELDAAEKRIAELQACERHVEVSDEELNAALQLHRLKVDGHSQLSDAFRAGFKYARRAAAAGKGE